MRLSVVADEAFSTVVLARAGGSALPLFFIHGVGGILPDLAPLLEKLDAAHPIYFIISQAFDPGVPPLLTLEEMAGCYLRDMRKAVPHGPYGLIGFSFGGMVAYEMAQQLQVEQCFPPVLLMLDSMEMSRLKRQAQTEPTGRRIRDLHERLSRRFEEAFHRPDTLSYVREKITSRSFRMFYSLTSKLGIPLSGSEQNPYHVNWFAAVNYAPKQYSEPFYLFKARDHYWGPRTPHDLGWGPFAGKGVTVVEIPGDHVSLFKDPALSVLADAVKGCLQHRTSLAEQATAENDNYRLPRGSRA